MLTHLDAPTSAPAWVPFTNPRILNIDSNEYNKRTEQESNNNMFERTIFPNMQCPHELIFHF